MRESGGEVDKGGREKEYTIECYLLKRERERERERVRESERE